MRAFMAPLVLCAGLVLPLSAQSARFIKVDITSKSARHHVHHGEGKAKTKAEPVEVHVRMPIAFAKSLLQICAESEIKINGEAKKGMKVDELIKLLENAKSGDMLLEVDTNQGDHVRIVLE